MSGEGSPTDASVIGTAEPIAKGTFFGEEGTWIGEHFPDGIELNLGPLLALEGAAVATLGTFVLLTFLGKRYAPDQYEVIKMGVRDALGMDEPKESNTSAAVGEVIKGVFDPLGLIF